MRFEKGRSGNPGGRPKGHGEIRELARQHTETALATLVEICQSGENESARVAAANAILDRGWGKAAQPLAGEEGGLPILARIERVIVDPSLQKNNENGSGKDDRAHT